MSLIGLLITRDDEAVFETWCQSQLSFYDSVVCLDGSSTDATERLAVRYRPQLHYLHERDFFIPHKTDHGLRRVVHREIVHRFGAGHWIMCCHADEFCYHDPRKIARLADRGGYDLVSWYSPHFYPHPTEWVDWETRRSWPVPERHRHYHWGHLSSGLPWIEDRLYRDGPGVEWDKCTHGSVRPHGLRQAAPFHPLFRHFKVIASDTAWCEVIGGSTYYRHHWIGLEHRTGVPFQVQRLEDLFVASVPKYAHCDRFDGVFDQPWNLGEEFRADQDRVAPANFREQTYLPVAPRENPPATVPPSTGSPEGQGQHKSQLSVAFGPENPAFGSWNWLGADLARELAADHDVQVFRNAIPVTDIVVFFKFLPSDSILKEVSQRSAILFCPVDVYGSAAEIDADATRLRLCDYVIVHCQRLTPYFRSYVPTSYCDHHLKYVIPPRTERMEEGPILWIGERSNLPPLVEWVNRHGLPSELVVVTNVDKSTSATVLGFRTTFPIHIESWSPDSHRSWLQRCRAAIDVKDNDFRARHKPPAKALDYLASGVPLAVTSPSSSRDHLASMGFALADPHDIDAWLSEAYAAQCRQFGSQLNHTFSLERIADHWRRFLREAVELRNRKDRSLSPDESTSPVSGA